MASRKKRFGVAFGILLMPRMPRPLRVVIFAVLLLLALPYAITPFYAFGWPVSTVMLWREVTGQRVRRQYVPLSRIARVLQLAVIAAEDGRFCSHHGIDFTEIREAINDADDLGDVRGSSTITQQVAKNLFLWPGRSFLRKALELPLALWIDLVLPKRRILEIYLNIAEWGPNGEFGIEAGGRRAFGKSANDLGRYQAALMAATLPNPTTRVIRVLPAPACAGWRAFMSRAQKGPARLQIACERPLALAGSILYKPRFKTDILCFRSSSPMAVPKRKTSPSRRGMRRSADALKQPSYVEDKDSGELRRPHHIDLKTGMYKGRQVLKVKTEA